MDKINEITPMDIVNLEISIELINTLSGLVNYKHPDKHIELIKLRKALSIKNINLTNKTLSFFTPIAKDLKNNLINLEDFCNDVRYKFEF